MTARLVLDASAALRIVLPAEDAAALLDRVEQALVVAAPDLFCCEVANALWKYVCAGQLELDEAIDRYDQAVHLVDELVPAADLAAEAMTSAARWKHPVYDMMYAVLARRHGCTLVTRDRRLSRAAAAMQIATT